MSADKIVRWLFASDPGQSPGRLAPRWIFLRALGLIFFSAFYSFLFQVRGLIGPDGLLPAGTYLEMVRQAMGPSRFWYAPTLLWWLGTSNAALLALCWVGLIASALLAINVWPRLSCAVCLLAFLSFIGSLQAFASYQSDGMLLGAGFLCLFFSPPGSRPGWGERNPPSRASLFLLQWLWFTIYFDSGVAKIRGGDPEWRHFTAMDEYYQNAPLPTWIAWYVQHLPHWFHAMTAAMTLGLELFLVLALFLPRRFRIVLFWIVTPWEIGVILTGNYAFLNYIVLSLGILLLDDWYLARLLPHRLRSGTPVSTGAAAAAPTATAPAAKDWGAWPEARRGYAAAAPWFAGFCLSWVFYATAAQLVWMIVPDAPLPQLPVVALETVRIAESYGLFAVMTRGRYEVEFQGSNDGSNWVPYPFRYKPQDPTTAPGIYAPYQPRFEWNLWFASLGDWQTNRFVISTEERLLENSPAVLALFRSNPFPGAPPKQIRAVLWRYWFSDWAEKHQGLWWRREMVGLYAPSLTLGADGQFHILAMPPPDLVPERSEQ